MIRNPRVQESIKELAQIDGAFVVSSDGVVIEKTYRFAKDSYLIDCDITIKNGSDNAFSDQLHLSLINSLSEDRMVYGFEGPSAFIDGDVQKIKPKNIISPI